MQKYQDISPVMRAGTIAELISVNSLNQLNLLAKGSKNITFKIKHKLPDGRIGDHDRNCDNKVVHYQSKSSHW